MTTTRKGRHELESVQILGVPIHRVDMDQALTMVESFIVSGKPHLVFTADATSIVMAGDDAHFMHLIRNADLVTPDGAGVSWAVRRKGLVPTKVSGVDLLDRICALSADKGYRLFFLGAAAGVAELAAEKLRLKHPGCNIVGTRHGYFPSESDEVVAREVSEFKPDVLFVAMGMPRQELFIRATEKIIGAKVSIGVGGSFDVYSGKIKRAPKWMQRACLEWLWRLTHDFSKIGKVKALPKFAWRVLRDRS